MNTLHTWRIARAASLVFLLAATGTAAFAQEEPPSATQLDQGAPVGDPPGRVARLNYFDGTVTMEPAGATDWAYAELNRPMTTGDQVWVDNGGRSELHIGSTALRLGSQTALSIVNLDDQSAQLKVAQGTLETRVRELPAGQSMEIDTPNVALQLSGPGIYRVDASPDGSTTTVTVRDGSLTAYGDTGSVQLGAGQQITFSGTNLQEAGGGTAQALDPFDDWAYSRDRSEDASPSARYVSRDIPGYQDLDANGSWEETPDYGNVWVPRVEAGWAPYHQGHWAWVAPWGWTWVDDAPWGFAPFHYGRWAYWHNNWAWVPGPVVATAPPCYSPALVAFVGGGNGGWNVSLAVGAAATAGVAWLALGPGEPWHPGYHYSPGYYNRANYMGHTTIVNNTTIINRNVTYVNRNVPGAVMGMPANQFVHGQDTRRYGQRIAPGQLQRASFGAGAPAIAPVRQSFGGALRPANYRPPQAVSQRQVIATRTPPTPYAYRDSLAQSFAHKGGTVPGAGQPVVRTAPPASYMHAPGPVAVPGRPGAPTQQPGRFSGQPGVRVIQAEHHAPTPVPGQPGQPGRVGEAGQPGQPGRVGEVGQPGQPGRPMTPGGVPSRAEGQQPGQPGRPITPSGEPSRAQGQQPGRQPGQGQWAGRPGQPEQAQGVRGNGVPRPPSAAEQGGRPGMQPGVQGGNPQFNAQQEDAQRRQQQMQQQAAQEQQQRAQMQAQQRGAQGQAQQEQQRGQQMQAQQEQQRAQQMQAQQEQQRTQQLQEQQRQQQESQRGQQAQQEQQRAQQMQEQQRQQQMQAQQEQQRQQQAQAQQEQQRAQQAQAQQRQQQEQQRAQQMQAQQRQQQMEQQRAQQAQAQQRQEQMQQMQQRQQQQQQQQQREQQRPQPQQHEQGHRDQQSNNGRGRDDHRG